VNQYNSIDPYGTYDIKGLSPYEMAMKMASWNNELRSTLFKTNEDLSNVQSTIVQHADAIGLRVLKEDYTGEIIASMIVVDPYAIGLIADNIDITGYVTFSDLAQSGRTVINGGNVMANTITSDHILVSQLSSIAANLGYVNAGYIYGVTIESSTFLSNGTDPHTGLFNYMSLTSGYLGITSGNYLTTVSAGAFRTQNGSESANLQYYRLQLSSSITTTTYGNGTISSSGGLSLTAGSQITLGSNVIVGSGRSFNFNGASVSGLSATAVLG